MTPVRRILLVRAVNVGGTAKLPMAEWRALAQSLGARDVSTYIASGNLVCTIDGDPAAFDRALEAAVEVRFGFFREVISRTRDELVSALAAHPFEVADPKFSYISFLVETPSAAGVEAARRLETGADRWHLIGRELHLRYADGAGRSQLNEPQLMRTLGTTGTSRNLNTVRRLMELAGETI
ncbi:DUF1697 domain-containing protein [Leucobacter triazinivorans]|uniref:DUF1697 domain-containing protein n=2 Tax=Leucobacter triazinivorans TaxID=1784719 RepID=A0A4P6KK42_9MICO|nr:DUF1697 domain-containing protein [Leucobacter triazinivorans]